MPQPRLTQLGFILTLSKKDIIHRMISLPLSFTTEDLNHKNGDPSNIIISQRRSCVGCVCMYSFSCEIQYRYFYNKKKKREKGYETKPNCRWLAPNISDMQMRGHQCCMDSLGQAT